MNLRETIIIPYRPEYAEQTVSMWRDSKEQAICQKEIHSFEEHVYFLNQIVPKHFHIDIALINQQVVGMIAYNDEEINQLYIHVDYQGFGIGQSFLDIAKSHSSGKLTVTTFELNKNAQRFYEKHGFQIVGRGHENEEGLPDIQYEWYAR